MRVSIASLNRRQSALALALASLCAVTLYARVYLDFERVRFKIVEVEQPSSQGSVSVRLPDLSSLEGQAAAIILRLRNETAELRNIEIRLDGSYPRSLLVGPGRVSRFDSSVANADELLVSESLELTGDGDGWSLEYLEIANVHGHSSGLFEFVIVPPSRQHYRAVPAIGALLLFFFLLPLPLMALGYDRRLPRIAHAVGAAVFLLLFVVVLLTPVVSGFKVLLSLRFFLLLAAVIYLPGLQRMGSSIGSWSHNQVQSLPGLRDVYSGIVTCARWLESTTGMEAPRLYGSVAALAAFSLYAWIMIGHTAFAAGGSDASGYVNSARWLGQGQIVVPVSALERFDLPVEAAEYFEPLGTVPGPESGTIAPYYPPGYPVHMVVLAWVGGWERGPFLVNPLVALLGLLVMYALAREVGLPRSLSALAAVSLGAWPTYMYMTVWPMSDLLATFWAMVAVLAALRSNRHTGWAVLAGAAFGIAVAVRPANGLLLLPLVLALRPALAVWVRFVAGGLPVALALFGYNLAAYGHPLSTGYSHHLGDDLQLAHFPARFSHYVYWLAATLTPLIPLGWLLLVADRKAKPRLRAILWTWFLSYFLFYCFYWHYDAWWYTRFLLPAIPALILAAMVTFRDVFASRPRRLRVAAFLAMLAAICWVSVVKNREFYTFELGESETVYPRSARWADENLPAQTVILAMQVSGSLTYYTDRVVVRWDRLDPEAFQWLREHLDARGIEMVALLFDFEVEELKEQLPVRWKKIGDYLGITLWKVAEPSN